MAPTNPTLEGHKLLLTMMYPTPQQWIDKIQKKFSHLQIVYHQLKHLQDYDFDPEVYKEVTCLSTYLVLPKVEQAPKLQYIQLSSAGANHLVKTPIYNIPNLSVCTANGIHPPQIAEWVIATYLAFTHHIPRLLDDQKQGKWVTTIATDVEDAVGLRMGILGYGAIGRQCACLASAMGMDVVVYTLRERTTRESRRERGYRVPGPKGDPEGDIPSAWFFGKTREALNNFLAQDLDILVICLPLTELTHHMISAPQFEILSKKKTFISNVGRGPHIKTDDLIVALERGQIRGAALDVTDPEPLPQDHPLWKAPNVFITPHVSAHSAQYQTRVLDILESNLERLSEGKPYVNMVNRDLGY